jgi:hypothetical protein
LDRLLAIRRLSEELDRNALAMALASVHEAESAIAGQEAMQAEAKQVGRQALTTGDRSEWLMADAQNEVAGWNRKRLETLREERAKAVPPAMEKFMESRLEHEQVKKLIENARQVAEIEGGRRAQAASDDWFLSRRMRLNR